MPICQKCNVHFPVNIKINGKKHNLCSRKYCLECSPFGKHNTKQLVEKEKKERPIRQCRLCGRKIGKQQTKGLKCWVCDDKIRREGRIKKLYDITGYACWNCGYDKCIRALDFHHVDPSQKKIALSIREMTLAWDRIIEEVQKCVLLCSNCHREYHAGLISDEKMLELYKSYWTNHPI